MWRCKYCSAIIEKRCQECRNCLQHCMCKGCVACSALSPDPISHPFRRCKTCQKCKLGSSPNHCSCRRMPQALPQPVLRGSSLLRNPLPRPLGLEIETTSPGNWGGGLEATSPVWNESPRSIRPAVWHWEHDGSVNGEAMELVIPPLVGDQFLDGIGWLGKYFSINGAMVDSSCGLHVHVGARDFGPYELRRLMEIHRRVEGEIFASLLPAWRGEPNPKTGKYYCRRWDMSPQWWEGLWGTNTPSDLRAYLRQWVFRDISIGTSARRVSRASEDMKLFDLSMPQARLQKYRVLTRYFALNLHTWFVRGTVEWRHHQGTLSPRDLIYWPLLCGWLTHLAGVISDKDLHHSKTILDFLGVRWDRPYSQVSVPGDVIEWVREELRKEHN